MAGFRKNKNHIIGLVSCFAFCYCVFLYFYISGNWLYISVPGLLPSFADFLFILAGSDCTAMGVDVVVKNPCDPWNRAHNYGLLWLQVGKLGLTRADITWVALTINAIFIFSALIIVSPASLSYSLASIVFIISPAVMLGLERANADLLIFSLLALSFYMVYSKNLILNGIGCLIILTAAILKLYPIVILPVLVFYYSANKAKLFLLLATLILFFLYLFLNWTDVSHLIGVIPNITWHYSMGGELLFSRLGYVLGDSTRLATYCMALAAILAGIIWGCRIKTDKTNIEHGWIGMLYLSGAVLVIFSFVIKNSFDYRNIYVLFLLPFLLALGLRVDLKSRLKFIACIVVVIFVFLFWAEFLVSIFNALPSSAIYIRLVESILNWVVIVPIVMLAMQVAIAHSKHSWLLSLVTDPLQKWFGKNDNGLDYE